MASTFVTVPSPLFSLRKTNNLSRSKQRRLLGPPTQSLRVSAIATKWEPSKVVPQADRVLVRLEQLPEETFAEYAARTSFERPLLTGVVYAPRVVDAQREQFERQHGWTIKTMEREPSPVRDEYAPVMFYQESLTHIKSLDMMSGELERRIISHD